MRTRLTIIFLFLFLVFLICGIADQSKAQVNITMRINTATCLDTLRPTDIVQIRGESTGSTTLTWENTSGVIATNIGGDYWEATFQANPGDVIRYKFWTGFNLDPADGTAHWDGWEGPFNTGTTYDNNRFIIVGDNDTTLALQYYNGWENSLDPFWRPFESKQDTVAVLFRVNMGGVIFDPATQLVDVRGGLPMGGAPDWITIKTLSQEVNSVNSGSFQSGVVYIPIDSIVVGTTEQQFKFVIQPDVWEGDPPGNRSFTFSGTNDTTIHWYYFNDRPPSGPAVTARMLFRLKLDALQSVGLFDQSLGDRVAVTGAKGWPPSDFDFSTEPTMIKMIYIPSLEEWNKVETFTKFPGEVIPYKYYIAWDTSRVDTTAGNPNYIPGLTLNDGWEEPGSTGGADRNYIYTDMTEQYPVGDFGYAQQFFNSIPPDGVITTPITVTFKIDITPATEVTENPTNPLFRPGTDTVYVHFDGCMTPITQGLTMYGTDNRIELTDPDEDLIYTGSWALVPPTFYQFCYRVTYTSESGDIRNGSDSPIRGRRYYQYVHPASINPLTWPASYELAELPWMLDSLTIEDPPLLSTGVDDIELLPNRFSISQNYPNPFNPETRIQYYIPERSIVKMQIYDITGRLVKNLSDMEQDAGSHIVEWSGKDNSGHKVASGIYFLKFTAGAYTNTVKMMLLK
ncbi:T9SS type A sorting domain-containing protein [bacterium BMS3Abin03]|nr:T9SS type A sorting domain-containing protein [bacterium BMS3Abin03]MCG6960221.1 T9SS type A sorting domain-containing protein [bacterium BMS3Abin03]